MNDTKISGITQLTYARADQLEQALRDDIVILVPAAVGQVGQYENKAVDLANITKLLINDVINSAVNTAVANSSQINPGQESSSGGSSQDQTQQISALSARVLSLENAIAQLSNQNQWPMHKIEVTDGQNTESYYLYTYLGAPSTTVRITSSAVNGPAFYVELSISGRQMNNNTITFNATITIYSTYDGRLLSSNKAIDTLVFTARVLNSGNEFVGLEDKSFSNQGLPSTASGNHIYYQKQVTFSGNIGTSNYLTIYVGASINGQALGETATADSTTTHDARGYIYA